MQNLLIFTVGYVALLVGLALWSVPLAFVVGGTLAMTFVIAVSILPSTKRENKQ